MFNLALCVYQLLKAGEGGDVGSANTTYVRDSPPVVSLRVHLLPPPPPPEEEEERRPLCEPLCFSLQADVRLHSCKNPC
jgi:hypothetical protein